MTQSMQKTALVVALATLAAIVIGPKVKVPIGSFGV